MQPRIISRTYLIYALFTAALSLAGIVGSFYSPVWPVLMFLTLAFFCMVQLVRLLGEIGPSLPHVGWLFTASARYHVVQPEQREEVAVDTGEAFELQQQVLAMSAAMGSPSRAAAFARVLAASASDRGFNAEDFLALQELDTLWGESARVGAGLTQEQINALPSWTYAVSPRQQQQQQQQKQQQQQQCCSICLEPFGAGDLLRTLPCVHNFHCACVDKWLSMSVICPECRSSCLGEGGAAGGAAADPWAPRGHADV
jgi:hypothetical protein